MWKLASRNKGKKVWCPIFQRESQVVAIQGQSREGASGASLPGFELKDCVLFKGRLINCAAECLRSRSTCRIDALAPVQR